MENSNEELNDYQSIKEKFKQRIYDLNLAPRILSMDLECISVNKNKPYKYNIEELVRKYKNERDNDGTVRIDKFKAFCCGDFQFHVEMINKYYFENRDDFDNRIVRKDNRTDPRERVYAKRISIKNAFKLCRIDFSCNMDFYLKNLNEMKLDLKRKIDKINLNDKNLLKKLEEELFYNQMCELFGDSEADDAIKPENDESLYEKTYVLKDFHILYLDGNTILASAERGNYYLNIFFVY
ncbi:unnamed protein product [Brachionus calyciflorus]|uniref:Uncharacterized protein n=1 Tax=Brachionus calyciflorus TaxID=104777 RepID=A0A814KF03_9BILA|nr:unnamed protein product [Brachionus calyciflorus]